VRILLENVGVSYDRGLPSATAALDGVSLSVEAGECVAVIGPTGSGKTTLLEVMSGLARPSSGRATLEPEEKGGLRSAVGLAYQFPESQFFEETVFADVAFGPRKQGVSGEEVEARVERALSRAGLEVDGYADRSPLSLSAGEKRRAAIAGIIALSRPFLLLDEPTAGLDPSSADTVARLVAAEVREGHGVIVVTHDLEFVDSVAGRTVVLSGGGVRADGDTASIMADQELLGRLGLEPPARYAVVNRLREMRHPSAERVAEVLASERPAVQVHERRGPLADPGGR